MISFVPPVPWHLDNPTGESVGLDSFLLSHSNLVLQEVYFYRRCASSLSVLRWIFRTSQHRGMFCFWFCSCGINGNAQRKQTILSVESNAVHPLTPICLSGHGTGDNNRLIKCVKSEMEVTTGHCSRKTVIMCATKPSEMAVQHHSLFFSPSCSCFIFQIHLPSKGKTFQVVLARVS